MRTSVVLCALALANCGTTGTTATTSATTATTTKIDIPSELQKAITEYRACVDAKAKRINACEVQRLAMEAEERAYFSQPVGTQPVRR